MMQKNGPFPSTETKGYFVTFGKTWDTVHIFCNLFDLDGVVSSWHQMATALHSAQVDIADQTAQTVPNARRRGILR